MSSVVPEGWRQSFLSELTTKITDGSHYSPPTVRSEFPIATVENMTETQIDIGGCRTISKEEFIKLSANSCRPQIGDVLFSKDGTIGKTLVYKQFDEIVLLSSIAIIRTIESKLSPEYLEQYLSSPLFFEELENRKSGSAIRRVVLGDLKSLPIPTAPLPEQKKIASILTSVDEVIESTQKQIDKLQDLKKATMNELLTKGIGHTEFKDSVLGRIPEGWEAKELGDIATFSGGSAFKEKYQGENSGKYPFIKVGDMNLRENNRFIIKAKNWISEDVKQQAKIKLFPSDSVVFAKVGAALFLNRRRQLIRETAIDNNMMAAIPKTCDHRFLFYAMQSVNLANIVQSGAVPSVNQSQMESIPAVIPPLPEQKKIASILTTMDKTIEERQRKLHQTQSLKKSLMQDLLTGKVRVMVN